MRRRFEEDCGDIGETLVERFEIANEVGRDVELIDVGHGIVFEGALALVEPAFVHDGGFGEIEFELMFAAQGRGIKASENFVVFAETGDFAGNVLGVANLELAVVLVPAEGDSREWAMFVMGADEFGGEAFEAGVGRFVVCCWVDAGAEEKKSDGCSR